MFHFARTCNCSQAQAKEQSNAMIDTGVSKPTNHEQPWMISANGASSTSRPDMPTLTNSVIYVPPASPTKSYVFLHKSTMFKQIIKNSAYRPPGQNLVSGAQAKRGSVSVIRQKPSKRIQDEKQSNLKKATALDCRC
ncbi:hypothetical protein K457DRAFT_12446 [Linnemannia elongata AG-77]|uniref:Uncharacterized protein n=1 Tax=Linnemannia elongata AG-77 TaxID=1314771 RepID=A0A197KI25_9FUNG|nr:hypothetical protein K457DRAFT_12446 [Linnemannia elongata AG-77]